MFSMGLGPWALFLYVLDVMANLFHVGPSRGNDSYPLVTGPRLATGETFIGKYRKNIREYSKI